jgi:phage FluMu gp28-like protein
MTDKKREILLPYQKQFLKLCDNHRCVIVRKGRQSGFTMVAALWAVRQRLKKTTSNCYYVSRTERTAKQFARYVKLWCEVLNISSQEQLINLKDSSQSVINFPAGNYIQVMPSGPDVCRGLPGDVIMDEAAYHDHAQEFYDSTFPTIQAGHQFIVISTVGLPGTWYEDEWDRAEHKQSVFEPFKITMDEAVDQGLADYQPGPHQKHPKGPERNKAFLDFIKRGMSQEAYDAEYNCIQRGLGSLISMQEYDKQALVEVFDSMVEFDEARRQAKQPIRELFACIDPAFSHDLAAIWILERHYDPSPDVPDEYRDVYVTVVVNAWHKVAPRALHQIVKQYLHHECLVKCLVDQGGPGYQLAHDLEQEFGQIVEPLVITNPVKQEAYERLKYFLQTDRLALPKDRPDIRQEFLSVARKMTPGGAVSYEGRIQENHADRFAACAFCLHAAESEKAMVGISSKESKLYRPSFN